MKTYNSFRKLITSFFENVRLLWNCYISQFFEQLCQFLTILHLGSVINNWKIKKERKKHIKNKEIKCNDIFAIYILHDVWTKQRCLLHFFLLYNGISPHSSYWNIFERSIILSLLLRNLSKTPVICFTSFFFCNLNIENFC